MIIIPTILEKQFELAEKRVSLIRRTTSWIQIDVTDDNFVPGKSFELELLNGFEKSEEILWDIHLMVKEPINWLEKCIHVGASRITGQVEKMNNREEFIKKIKDEGIEAGLAFEMETKIDNIPEETDLLLLMGRKAGFGWAEMNEEIYKRIGEAKTGNKLVAIDGGVTKENILKLEKAGVDIVYSGSRYLELI